jgi:CCR4-NOT complex subunit CAF16
MLLNGIGLGDWPSHLAHLQAGRMDTVHSYTELGATMKELQAKSNGFDSPLLLLVEQWLRKDFVEARRRRDVMAHSETKWDKMSNDVKKYGDKFYNYWG